MRYRLDSTWWRLGSVVLAGSPLRLFRTTDAGRRVAERLDAGADVDPSPLTDRLLDAGAIHPVPDADGGRFDVDDVTVVTPQLRRRPDEPTFTDGRIVVDDGSTPPIPGAAVRLAATQGPGAARNAGRPCVTTPLIAFVDADVDLGADPTVWLGPMLGHFDDDAVALVAPRVLGEHGSPLDLGDEPARIRAGTRVSYVPGAALVVRVAAFDAVGGFDPSLRFGEDVDLVWRLDEAGWRCRYEPAASVWHEPRHAVVPRLRQHAHYGTSAAPLALRHPGALAPARCNGWTASAWLALAVGHPIAAATLAIGSAAALRLDGVPRRVAFGLALRGHVVAGRQFAQAVRRAWWPIVVCAAVVSRRARRVAVASVLLDWRAAPTDIAYGWGVWTGMWRHRTAAPIAPAIRSWPRRERSGTSPRPRARLRAVVPPRGPGASGG